MLRFLFYLRRLARTGTLEPGFLPFRFDFLNLASTISCYSLVPGSSLISRKLEGSSCCSASYFLLASSRIFYAYFFLSIIFALAFFRLYSLIFYHRVCRSPKITIPKLTRMYSTMIEMRAHPVRDLPSVSFMYSVWQVNSEKTTRIANSFASSRRLSKFLSYGHTNPISAMKIRELKFTNAN